MNKIPDFRHFLLVVLFVFPGFLISQTKNWDVQENDVFEVTESSATIIFTNFDTILTISCDEINLQNKRINGNPPSIQIVGDQLFIGLIIYQIDRDINLVFFEDLTQSKLTVKFKKVGIPLGEVDSISESELAIQDLVSAVKYPVYDAITLAAIFTDKSVSPDIATRNKIYDKYEITKARHNENPFLTYYSKSRSEPQSAELDEIKGTSAITGLGGLDVTKFADGIAKFLVKRTKEELSITFFKKFQEVLNEYEDLKSLFPQTHSGLEVIGSEIYNFHQYITTLREQFENDLKLLPDHFPKIIDNHEDYFKSKPAGAAFIRAGSYFASSIRDEIHPGKIIKDMPADSFEKVSKDLYASIQSFQLLSEALKANEGDGNERYWIDKTEFKELISSEDNIRVFLGLVFEEAKNANIAFEKVLLEKVLEYVALNFDRYVNEIKQFLSTISIQQNRVNQILKAKKSKDYSQLDFEDLLNYFDASMDLLSGIKDFVDVLPLKIDNSSLDKIDQFVVFSKASSNLVLMVNKGKYGAAIVSLTELIEQVIELTSSDEFSPELKDKVLKYGSFMASMAQAKNSDEVAAVIESFALPTGSARIKRESKWNVALNGYVGIYGGAEKSRVNTTDKFDGLWGLTAPVGISISRGAIGKSEKKDKCGKLKYKGRKSVTAFFSLIDVGAITSFRFTNDTLDVPKIYLKEIISPGAFLSFGFGKVPISLTAGYQVSPRLRRIGGTENEVDLEYYGRLSGSIVVDIPFLNFYTKVKD